MEQGKYKHYLTNRLTTIIKKMPNPVKAIPPINDKAILAILLVGHFVTLVKPI